MRNTAYDSVNVTINSPGGDVFPAIGLCAALRTCGKPVNVNITGVAASAASVIAMAGSSIKIYDSAWLMIHKAWTLAIGNANDLRSMADLLDGVDGSLLNEYHKTVARLGDRITKNDITSMMTAETWINAADSATMGLVDEVYTGTDVSNNAKFNLEAYTNVPEALTNSVDRDEVINNSAIIASLSRKLKLIERRA